VRRVLSIILFLVVLLTALMLKACNPSDDYYVSLFKEISGLTLSIDTEFVSKSHKEYFVQGEFGSCFVVRLNNEQKETFIQSTIALEKPIQKSCGSDVSRLYSRKGNNRTDYPFMNWYISKDNYLWAYYEKY